MLFNFLQDTAPRLPRPRAWQLTDLVFRVTQNQHRGTSRPARPWEVLPARAKDPAAAASRGDAFFH